MRFKRKKVRRQRASTFHGWGRGAAHHKGAGNRGGRGRSGSGKKADQKKPMFWKETVGKSGFASKNRMQLVSINIEAVVRNLDAWVEQGSATKKQGGYQIDLKKAGFDKLLAKGEASTPLFIVTDFASKSAVAKIAQANGQVTIQKTIVKKVKKQPTPDKKKTKDEPSEE